MKADKRFPGEGPLTLSFLPFREMQSKNLSTETPIFPLGYGLLALLWALLVVDCASHTKFYGREEIKTARQQFPGIEFESTRWYENGSVFALRVHASVAGVNNEAGKRCRGRLHENAGAQIIAFFNGIRIDSTRPDPEYKADKMIAIARASGILRHIDHSDYTEKAGKKDFGCSSLAVVFWPGLKTKLLNGEFLFQN